MNNRDLQPGEMYSILSDSPYGERIQKRMDIYVYEWLIHFAVHLKLT